MPLGLFQRIFGQEALAVDGGHTAGNGGGHGLTPVKPINKPSSIVVAGGFGFWEELRINGISFDNRWTNNYGLVS